MPDEDVIETPSPALPEMTLRFAMPEVSAPMVVLEVPAAIVMPLPPLGRAAVPVTSVPMKLPQITVPVVPLSVTRMPLTALPEITFQAAVLKRAGGVLPADGVAARPEADVDAVDLLRAGQEVPCRWHRCR